MWLFLDYSWTCVHLCNTRKLTYLPVRHLRLLCFRSLLSPGHTSSPCLPSISPLSEAWTTQGLYPDPQEVVCVAQCWLYGTDYGSLSSCLPPPPHVCACILRVHMHEYICTCRCSYMCTCMCRCVCRWLSCTAGRVQHHYCGGSPAQQAVCSITSLYLLPDPFPNVVLEGGRDCLRVRTSVLQSCLGSHMWLSTEFLDTLSLFFLIYNPGSAALAHSGYDVIGWFSTLPTLVAAALSCLCLYCRPS